MIITECTGSEQVEARIWEALRHVDDPEIPARSLARA